ncbi:6-phosphofructokinase [Zoogloea sp.]|uniref:6-phosphofructokinase n=1 Tax=Zoogloea sp. TaxID=49181 RepID=UPI0026108A67|nr:6-phosphofructokinase [Zoogloea sp.]MDD3354585.1 6-phosphofructokinase [Zoogloea sp.]
MARNLLYAQSGGMTAVINASAAGVIATAREAGAQVGQVLAARNGILGVLRETLIDTAALSAMDLERLRTTPGGAFGSCRFDLDALEVNPAQYERLFAVLATHDIGYLLYNGGNGSMETCRQIQEAADRRGYALTVVGVPKTIDNDIVLTDCCPGFGSAAKYLATSVREVGLDLRAMTTRGGRAFVLEVMGRNAGWLAAACDLASEAGYCAPHLILMPEVVFDEAAFLERVRVITEAHGACVIVAAEGIKGPDGRVLSMQEQNAKGYVQLGGAGEVVAQRIHQALGYKVHYAVADYLQRAARHLASRTDAAQAFAVGKAAVRRALGGRRGVIGLKRISDVPYRWRTTQHSFESVANLERKLPPEFIAPDGFGVTEAFRVWCRPLIAGEDFPRFRDGLPDYLHLRLACVPRQLSHYEA